MDLQSKDDILVNEEEPVLRLVDNDATNSDRKNNVKFEIVNVNKLKIKDELISKLLYVQSLPFVIKIKRQELFANKDVLTVKIVLDKEIHQSTFPITITADFYATNSRFKSFNEVITKDLTHGKNSISNSIDWNDDIKKIKNFAFETEITVGLPGFKGIHNEGATCYINVVLQSLFYINKFRCIVYKIPIDVRDDKSLFLFWLQYMFYNLQFDTFNDIRTLKFINCFEWTGVDMTKQQDIHEFQRQLMTKLEKFVEHEEEIKNELTGLFVGQSRTISKCSECEFHRSSEIEIFWDIQLPVDGDDNIQGAFQTYFTESPISE